MTQRKGLDVELICLAVSGCGPSVKLANVSALAQRLAFGCLVRRSLDRLLNPLLLASLPVGTDAFEQL